VGRGKEEEAGKGKEKRGRGEMGREHDDADCAAPPPTAAVDSCGDGGDDRWA
jgi:hypothetical protein